jgi:predicted nucleic acid-binding protein
MWPLCRVTPDVELFDRALDIHGATGFPFYDSLIVAAAVQSSCATLLSEDLQSDRTIQGVRIQNPFVTA